MVAPSVTARDADSAADRIVFLGHSSVLLELGGVRVLTDPLLRGRVLHLRRQVPPVAERMLAQPDAVLISHVHHDHLDLASLRLLGRDTPLIVPAGAGAWLRGRGFASVTELSVGEDAKVHALTVSAVQARHDAHRLGVRGPRAEPLGYLMSSGRVVVYFAGDTELFAEMADFSPAPDVALLPVAGWGPTLGPGHMDPLQAAQAAAVIRPRLAIPVHWGTLLPIGLARGYRERLGDPPREFAEHAAQLAPDTEVRILLPGQATEP
jgi:L-ascorbate metabolism protein UlaG (beta-lactamase superfamily)